MADGSNGPPMAELGLKESDLGINNPQEVAKRAEKNLDRLGFVRTQVQQAFSHFDAPLTDLDERIDYTKLNVQAKIQDLLTLEIIDSTLGWLQRRGSYKDAQPVDVRRSNLIITNEVVEILADSSVPFKEAILMLNRVCTTGGKNMELVEATIEDENKAVGYRDVDVKVGKYSPPNYQDVPGLMEAFTERLSTIISKAEVKNQDDAICIAAWAYLVLVSIHPFPDGNGRTARALTDLVLLRLGQKDFPAVSIDKSLSRGTPFGLGNPEEDAQTEAGFITGNQDKSTAQLRPPIKERISTYIDNTPEQSDGWKPGSISGYAGVGKIWEIFTTNRAYLNQFLRTHSNPIIESSLKNAQNALIFVRGLSL